MGELVGTNVRKLTAEKMTVDAIPKGGGLAAGLNFLSNSQNIVQGWRNAAEWVKLALKTIREAPDSEWKNASDEAIAAEILRKIEVKRGAKRHA